MHLFYISHLCKLGMGNSGSKLMWILSLIFTGLDFQPKMKLWGLYSCWTPWWTSVQIPLPSVITVNLPYCHRLRVRPTNSINALFLSGCWSLVDWKQLDLSKPLRSSAARGSRVDEERPCASAGHQQSQFTDCFRGLHGYVCTSKLDSARASSVSPQTTGANRNGPWAVLTSKQTPNIVWKSSGCAGLQLCHLALKTIVSQFSWAMPRLCLIYQYRHRPRVSVKLRMLELRLCSGRL